MRHAGSIQFKNEGKSDEYAIPSTSHTSVHIRNLATAIANGIVTRKMAMLELFVIIPTIEVVNNAMKPIENTHIIQIGSKARGWRKTMVELVGFMIWK